MEPASFPLNNIAVEAFYFNFLPLVDHMPTSKLIIRGPDFFLFYKKGYCEAKRTREAGLGADICRKHKTEPKAMPVSNRLSV